jgi:hypothetical protein
LAGPASFALRGAIAADSGSVVAHPAASRPAVVADAWMKVLRVSLINVSSPWV